MNKSCIMLQFLNFAKTEWILISCFEPLLFDIVCQYDRSRKFSQEIVADIQICESNQLIKGQMCFEFFFSKNPSKLQPLHQKKILTTFEEVKELEFVFQTIDQPFPPILLEARSVHFDKMFDTYLYKTNKIRQKGFLILRDQSFQFDPSDHSNIFICGNNSFISIQSLCDGKIDCPENMVNDESNCSCSINKPVSFLFEHNACPIFLSFKWKKSNENWSMQHAPNFNEAENSISMSSCREIGMFDCFQQNSCFDVSDICTYSLNTNSSSHPCLYGNHLQNCEHFECNTKFKCPGYYCIPWILVCDSKWDCPQGYDEDHCGYYKHCNNMFRCRGNSSCAHLGVVCDRKFDCAFGDDEQNCDLFNHKCPFSCLCLAYSVECEETNIEMNTPPFGKFPYLLVSLRNSNLSSVKEFVEILPKVIFLSMNFVGIQDICQVYDNSNQIIHIDHNHNSLRILCKVCFRNMNSLVTIKLNHNRIHFIQRNAFHNNSNLSLLQLSFNQISVLESQFVHSSSGNLVLSLLNNKGKMVVSKDVFQILNLFSIQTDQYILCCFAPEHVACNAVIPWFKSCGSILPNQPIKYCFILMSLCIIVLNVSSLVVQKKQKAKISSSSLNIMTINFSDMLCGLYLSIIWISNFYLTDMYILYEEKWLSGPPCFASFFIFLCFNFLAPLVLFILSLSRHSVTTNPLKSKFLNRRYLSFVIFGSTTSILTICVAFTLFVKSTVCKLPFSLCTPHFDPASSTIVFKVLTVAVTALQVTISVAIVLLYFCLLTEIKRSGKAAGKKEQSKVSNNLVILLSIVSCTNIICWFPSNTIYLSSIFLSNLSPKLIIWTTVVGTPLNSMFNPLVFLWSSLRSVRKKQQSNTDHSLEKKKKNSLLSCWVKMC